MCDVGNVKLASALPCLAHDLSFNPSYADMSIFCQGEINLGRLRKL